MRFLLDILLVSLSSFYLYFSPVCDKLIIPDYQYNYSMSKFLNFPMSKFLVDRMSNQPASDHHDGRRATIRKLRDSKVKIHRYIR